MIWGIERLSVHRQKEWTHTLAAPFLKLTASLTRTHVIISATYFGSEEVLVCVLAAAATSVHCSKDLALFAGPLRVQLKLCSARAAQTLHRRLIYTQKMLRFIQGMQKVRLPSASAPGPPR
ncbi:hypothetical protein NEDG_00045 [Nematocida displodere]|uniref:Uncharacterized protein n=1 Tax=Nematocida displodere TaxID=1805483 RepID=A0A177EJL2_9MICR|nr:hypothetical protein NEDG_00045 [Nematocida displodere]